MVTRSRIVSSFARSFTTQRKPKHVSSSFSAEDVDGLALWLDPSFGAYQERTSPTNLSDANGDPVGTWIDRSASIIITAFSDARRPTFQSEGLNGTPGLVFDGVDDFLPFPSSQLGILRNKPYAYVFAAVRATREAAYGDLFLASINVSENARFLVRLNDSNTAGRVAFYSRRADASTSSSLVVANYFASTSTFVISAASLWATSDGWLRKDGVEVASSTSWTTDGNTPDANSAYVTIGANAGTSVYMDATLGDFLIYTPSTAMATEDIEAIESWLATRAGL